MSALSRRKILLVRLPIPPLGPAPIRGNVPLAAAYLKLWAEQRGPGCDYAIDILPAHLANVLGDRALAAEIARRQPWLVGFTCYLWNVERTLWIARELKRLRGRACASSRADRRSRPTTAGCWNMPGEDGLDEHEFTIAGRI